MPRGVPCTGPALRGGRKYAISFFSIRVPSLDYSPMCFPPLTSPNHRWKLFPAEYTRGEPSDPRLPTHTVSPPPLRLPGPFPAPLGRHGAA